MDFKDLIGLDEKIARQFLEKNGYNNIETIINSKHNDLCDTLVVCAVRNNGTKVTLVCGEFYMDLKG